MPKISAETFSALPIADGLRSAITDARTVDRNADNVRAVAGTAIKLLGETWNDFATHVVESLRKELRFDAAALRGAALSWRAPAAAFDHGSILSLALSNFSAEFWVDIAQHIRYFDPAVPPAAFVFPDEEALSFFTTWQVPDVVTEFRTYDGVSLARIEKGGHINGANPKAPNDFRVTMLGSQDHQSFRTYDEAHVHAAKSVQEMAHEHALGEVDPSAVLRHVQCNLQGALDPANPYDAQMIREVGDRSQVLMRKEQRVRDRSSVQYMIMGQSDAGPVMELWQAQSRSNSDQFFAAKLIDQTRVDLIVEKLAAGEKARFTGGKDTDMTSARVAIERVGDVLVVKAAILDHVSNTSLCEAVCEAPVPTTVLEREQELAPARAM